MSLLDKLASTIRKPETGSGARSPDQRGRLRHVFVFESGPLTGDEKKYSATVVRSLLPEVMAYDDVPVSFQLDPSLPMQLGHVASSAPEKAIQYPFVWKKIIATNPDLVEGLKAGNNRFTFCCEEYARGANRGLMIAFYELVR